MSIRRRYLWLRWMGIGLVGLVVALGGCASPTATPFTASPMPTRTVSATPTLAPSPTPTPQPPAAVLLVAPDAEAWRAPAAAWLEALAQAQGYRFVVVAPEQPLPPHTVVAVGVGVVPPTTEEARRLVLALPPEADAAGAQVLRPGAAAPEARAFLAGEIAVLITEDWRAGLVGVEDEQNLAQAFTDGGRYFCGLCRPLHPPFVAYPQYALAPANASAEEWGATVARLRQAGVTTFALTPAALQAYQAGTLTLPTNAQIIALDAVDGDGEGENFIAAVAPDVAAGLDALWAHPETQEALLPVRVQVFDPAVLTPGKQRVVEETRALLEEGLVEP